MEGRSFLPTLWHHWLEGLIIPFIITTLALSARDGGWFGITFDMWMAQLPKTITAMFIIGLFIYRSIGSKDFRFRIFLHIMVIVLMILMVGTMLPGTGVMDALVPTAEAMISYLTFAVVGSAIVIGTIYSIFATIQPFNVAVSEVAHSLKGGDMDARITDKDIMQDTEFGPIASFINEIIDAMSDMIRKTTDTMEMIANASESLATNATEMAASAQEVSSTSQAMSTGASQQSSMASDIVNLVYSGNEIISNIISQIQYNTQAVSQIALQTNILALNAGIEASRAGDYGRGFAVVAENVRKLSDQSRKSAENISEVVETITNTLQDLFNQIQEAIENVSSISEETAASTEEVAASIEEINASMELVSGLSVDLSKQAEETFTNLANLFRNTNGMK